MGRKIECNKHEIVESNFIFPAGHALSNDLVRFFNKFMQAPNCPEELGVARSLSILYSRCNRKERTKNHCSQCCCRSLRCSASNPQAPPASKVLKVAVQLLMDRRGSCQTYELCGVRANFIPETRPYRQTPSVFKLEQGSHCCLLFWNVCRNRHWAPYRLWWGSEAGQYRGGVIWEGQ